MNANLITMTTWDVPPRPRVLDEMDLTLAAAHARLSHLRTLEALHLLDPDSALAIEVAEQTIDLLTPFSVSHPHLYPEVNAR